MPRPHESSRRAASLCALALAFLFVGRSAAQDSQGVIASNARITDGESGFTGPLRSGDGFGKALGGIGDLDGDGVPDLAVGAPADNPGGQGGGAVWVLFLRPDGSVRDEALIDDASAGLGLQSGDAFGHAVAGLGDLDGLGGVNVAVGAPGDDTGGSRRGAVRVLSLDAGGAVQSFVLIADGVAGLALDDADGFGSSVASLGDLDGNGVADLAVGAPGDDDRAGLDSGFTSGANLGACYLLFLEADGSVSATQKLSAAAGGFGGALDNGDAFGSGLAALGDLDGDGRGELAIGAIGDDDGGSGRGAVWILSLNADGTSASETKISSTSGGFGGALDNNDLFGGSLAALGDLDGDGSADLAVSAPGDDDGGSRRGAFWLLFLRADGTVASAQKVSDTSGGFEGELADGDVFGAGVSALGDLSGDGVVDLAAGAPGGANAQMETVGVVFTLLVTGPESTSRNGSGCNPIAYFEGATPPTIGAQWDPFVEFADPPGLQGGDILINFVGVSGSMGSDALHSPAGACNELLISLDPEDLVLIQVVPVGAVFQIPLPMDPGAVGLLCFTQGGDMDVFGEIRLTNALDIVIGF